MKQPIDQTEPGSEQLFFILNIGRVWGNAAVWWGPNDAGYTSRLESAGRYSEARVASNPGYYNNGTETMALPCELVEGVSHRCVDPGELRVMLAKEGVNL